MNILVKNWQEYILLNLWGTTPRQNAKKAF